MDKKLKNYLDSGEYLPDFMMDFHDQKLLFKRLNRIVENRQDGYTDNINWIEAQVYTVDIFLYFMADHGYTLQKSRKKVDFSSITDEMAAYNEEQQDI